MACQTIQKGQHGQRLRDENTGKTDKWKAMTVFEVSSGRDDEMQKKSIEQNLEMKKEQNYLKLRIKKYIKNKGRISKDILVTCI